MIAKLRSRTSYRAIMDWLHAEFGIVVKSSNTLVRYREREVVPIVMEEHRQLAANCALAASANAEAGGASQNMEAAAGNALRQTVAAMALDPEANLAAMAALYRVVLAERKIELQREQVDLTKRRLALLESRAEAAKKIVTDPKLTVEEQNRKIRRLLGIFDDPPRDLDPEWTEAHRKAVLDKADEIFGLKS